MEALVPADGWPVEAVVVRVSRTRPDRQMLRVGHGRCFATDRPSVEGIDRHVHLAGPVPEQRG